MASVHMTVAIFNEGTGWSLPRTLLERIIDAAGDDIRVRQVETRTELFEALPETEYLIGFPLAYEQFSAHSSKMKWVQLTSSSGDAIRPLLPAMRKGLRVSTATTIRAPQIAEHAMALTLTLMRGIHTGMLAASEHRWAAEEIARSMRTLQDATMGIVAIGTFGQEIAQRAKAFGTKIIATRRDPENPYLFVDEILPTNRINELMQVSDVVVVATPRVPATEHIIDRKQFHAMKKSAILVDVSRGGVVRHSALVEALQRGRIAGAGLDVFESEPLPPGSPLWTMRNVVITPHVAASSPRYWEHAVDIICHNIMRMRDGRALIDEITPEWFEAPAYA